MKGATSNTVSSEKVMSTEDILSINEKLVAVAYVRCGRVYQDDRPSPNLGIQGSADMAIQYIACMALVAQFYHLPPRIIPVLQAVEGGKPGSISRNANGTEDFGVMQINSIWIEPLAKRAKVPETVLRQWLIDDACFNIAASGAILRLYLDEAKGDLMTAIGNYHSHTPELHARYRLLVLQAARRLFTAPQRK